MSSFLLAHRSTFFSGFKSHTVARRMSSAYGNNAPLVLSPRHLQDLEKNENNLVILDASWHMPNSPRKAKDEYRKKHIPGARYLDLDEVASPHELGLKHMMPTREIFAEACGTRLALSSTAIQQCS